MEWLEDEKEYLMEEVRVKTLQLLRPRDAKPKTRMEELWQIDLEQYQVGISQLKWKGTET